MLFRKSVVACLATFIISSCNSPLYKPVLTDSADTVEYNMQVKGRELYINNCASCHTLYYPHQYSPEKWKYEIENMKDKTKLTDTEAELVLKYLSGNNKAKK